MKIIRRIRRPQKYASETSCLNDKNFRRRCPNQKIFITFVTPAEIAQLVERQLPKLNVEGSSPFFRSKRTHWCKPVGFRFLQNFERIFHFSKKSTLRGAFSITGVSKPPVHDGRSLRYSPFPQSLCRFSESPSANTG